MKRSVGLALALATLLCAGLFGGRAATAQTAPVSATIYNLYGQAYGTAFVAVSSGGMSIAVALNGAPANAAYAVCAVDPLSAQTWRSCAGSTSAIYGGCATAPGFACTSLNAQATLTTDAGGNGQASFAIPNVMPSVVVIVTNVLYPSDNAWAVVNTGAVGSWINVCPAFC